MSAAKLNRRMALESLGNFVAGSSLAVAGMTGDEMGTHALRLPPVDEVVDIPKFENEARKKLSKVTFDAISGSERQGFDRMSLVPRYMIETMEMDVSIELLGQKMIAPILIGATPDQKRFHPDGELATARGASGAKALMVVSSESSVPLEQIAEQATGGFWYQVSHDDKGKSVRVQMQEAVKAGCKAICIAIAPGVGSAAPRPDWDAIEKSRQGISVPVLVKGIMTAADAKAAVQRGVQGIIVSCNTAPAPVARPTAVEVLPSIADAVQGKVAVLMDGSIRWGTDIFKALALGANAVVVARPAMWGLAAYGEIGVQTVVEMLQSDLPRIMAMCGNLTPASIERAEVKIHGMHPNSSNTRVG